MKEYDADALFSKLHRTFVEAGVRPNQVVAIEDLMPEELLVATFALWSVDAIPFPIVSRPKFCIADFILSGDLRVHRAGGIFDRRGLASTAVLHQTSGSTRSPRVARRSIRSVTMETLGYWRGLELTPTDTVRIPIPLFHSFGWGVAISSALRGCQLNVGRIRLPSQLSREVDSGGVSKLVLVPSLARLLTQTKIRGTGRLSTVIIGAGTASEDLLLRFRAQFGISPKMGYGSTETGGTFIGLTGIGKPIGSIEVLGPCLNEQGELVLRMPSPVLGHVGTPPSDSCEWRTGDLVRREPDGSFWYVDRLDDAVRANGRFIDIAQYRDVLRSMSNVDDIAFAVVPGAIHSEIEEFHIAVSGKDVSMSQVVDTLGLLPSQNLAPHISILDQLPRNEIGKLDRDELTRFLSRGRG